MNRLSTTVLVLSLSHLLALLAACGATNTGNPNGPGGPGGGDAPEGVELIRSSLQREENPVLSEAERTQAGLDSRDFALSLYEQARSGESGDVFISPYSVSVALAMTYAGAATETKTEMMNALHFGLPEPQLHAAWNAIDQALEGRATELAGGDESEGDGLKLEITNAAFLLQGFRPLEPFLDTLAMHYGAGIYAADGDPETIRVSINDWTAERTNDRIRDLLPMHSLDAAVLVLLNAIYFKASWLAPFEAALTQPGTFHAPGGDVTVDMMHGSPAETYAVGDGYQAATLPYISPDVEMFLILPDEGRFDEIEAGFDRAFFDRVHGELSSDYEISVTLPRFTIEGASVSLVEALKALGMERAFGGTADLSGIGGDPGELYISDVLHQAFIALDEEGTEAAAATAVVVSVTSVPPPKTPVDFVVDRPCLFAIYDKPTGQILFVGRLTDPS